MRTWVRWFVKINKTTMNVILEVSLQRGRTIWQRSIVISTCVKFIKILLRKKKLIRLASQTIKIQSKPLKEEATESSQALPQVSQKTPTQNLHHFEDLQESSWIFFSLLIL